MACEPSLVLAAKKTMFVKKCLRVPCCKHSYLVSHTSQSLLALKRGHSRIVAHQHMIMTQVNMIQNSHCKKKKLLISRETEPLQEWPYTDKMTTVKHNDFELKVKFHVKCLKSAINSEKVITGVSDPEGPEPRVCIRVLHWFSEEFGSASKEIRKHTRKKKTNKKAQINPPASEYHRKGSLR